MYDSRSDSSKSCKKTCDGLQKGAMAFKKAVGASEKVAAAFEARQSRSPPRQPPQVFIAAPSRSLRVVSFESAVPCAKIRPLQILRRVVSQAAGAVSRAETTTAMTRTTRLIFHGTAQAGNTDALPKPTIGLRLFALLREMRRLLSGARRASDQSARLAKNVRPVGSNSSRSTRGSARTEDK